MSAERDDEAVRRPVVATNLPSLPPSDYELGYALDDGTPHLTGEVGYTAEQMHEYALATLTFREVQRQSKRFRSDWRP